MNCPKCNKKMEIMVRLEALYEQDGAEHANVLGRCWDCDFDATWNIKTDIESEEVIEEYGLTRYFFG